MRSTRWSLKPGQIAATAVAALGFTLVAAGCPDPQGTFDAFGERYQKAFGSTSASTTGSGGGCAAPMPGQLDGDFLFSLSAKIAKEQAIALDMKVTTTDVGGALSVNLKATPLSAMDHMTPVGAEFDGGTFTVNADGTFDADLGEITVPGDANTVTPGMDIVATVQLHGSICDSSLDFVCGTVTGQASKPIMLKLDGSAFTMQRVKDGKLPFPVIDCMMTPAKYN